MIDREGCREAGSAVPISLFFPRFSSFIVELSDALLSDTDATDVQPSFLENCSEGHQVEGDGRGGVGRRGLAMVARYGAVIVTPPANSM